MDNGLYLKLMLTFICTFILSVLYCVCLSACMYGAIKVFICINSVRPTE